MAQGPTVPSGKGTVSALSRLPLILSHSFPYRVPLWPVPVGASSSQGCGLVTAISGHGSPSWDASPTLNTQQSPTPPSRPGLPITSSKRPSLMTWVQAVALVSWDGSGWLPLASVSPSPAEGLLKGRHHVLLLSTARPQAGAQELAE